MRRARTFLLRARFSFRMRVGRMPVLFHLVVLNNALRVRQPHVVVTKDTTFVMDGFPSSGNSYAIAALRAAATAESRELPRLAHHLHCPRQVVQGIRRGLPVLVLVREPNSCIPSTLTRWPFAMDATLRSYAAYYESLLPYVEAGDAVIGLFPRVTEDFGGLIRDVNARFGSDLPVLPADGSGAEVGEGLYDPSAEGRVARREQAAKLRAELGAQEMAALVARAQAIYDRYAALAERPITR